MTIGGIPFLRRRKDSGTRVILPRGYRASVRWLPRLGDIFPDFLARSTDGELRFHDWAEGSWTYLFSHPAAFEPVCSTEVLDVACQHAEFRRRGVKPLSVARGTVEELALWSDELRATFGVALDYPLVADPCGLIARVAGMVHPKANETAAIRKSFLLDPALRIRVILEYPPEIGRSLTEVLRVVDALQAADRTGMLMPGGWCRGDPMLLGDAARVGLGETRRNMRVTEVTDYLQLVDQPATGEGGTRLRRRRGGP